MSATVEAHPSGILNTMVGVVIAELFLRATPKLQGEHGDEHQKQEVGDKIEHRPVADGQALGEGPDQDVARLQLA